MNSWKVTTVESGVNIEYMRQNVPVPLGWRVGLLDMDLLSYCVLNSAGGELVFLDGCFFGQILKLEDEANRSFTFLMPDDGVA